MRHTPKVGAFDRVYVLRIKSVTMWHMQCTYSGTSYPMKAINIESTKKICSKRTKSRKLTITHSESKSNSKQIECMPHTEKHKSYITM